MIFKNNNSNDFTISKRNKYNYVHYFKKINLILIISFEQNFNKT